MHPYYWFASLNISASFIAFLMGVSRRRYFDKAAGFILILLGVSFLTECIALYFAVVYHNNLPVYNLSNIIQAVILSKYLSEGVHWIRDRNLKPYLIGFSILFGILNMVFFQPIDSYNSHYFLYQSMLVCILGSVLCLQIALTRSLEEKLSPHFWLTTVLMLFYAFNFLHLSLYDFFTEKLSDYKYYIDMAILLLNVVTNLGFALVFLLYPKIYPSYAR